MRSAGYITDPWLMRRLAGLVAGSGFAGQHLRSHGFVQATDPDYMLSIADRGAEALATAGTIGSELADALKAEGRRRVATNEFFGHVAYLSLTAGKPSG